MAGIFLTSSSLRVPKLVAVVGDVAGHGYRIKHHRIPSEIPIENIPCTIP
ncbi:MAG: hypothetical protein CM15mP49_07660 [Actinomycetota bacterium]|nr:MAG: hypothetical protein CM15mP49_07660 [Actinomycetota bacterium]